MRLLQTIQQKHRFPQQFHRFSAVTDPLLAASPLSSLHNQYGCHQLLTDPSKLKQLIFSRFKIGTRKIIYDRHEYGRHGGSRTNARTYWLCRIRKCNARIIINEVTREVMPKNQKHNHEPPVPQSYGTDEVLLFKVVEFD